ncbi:MAG: inositol-3-phosphate synthase [Acidobacteriota bacterium]
MSRWQPVSHEVGPRLHRPAASLKIHVLCRDSILAAPIVLDSALCLDLAKRAGMSGPGMAVVLLQVADAKEVYPEHDLFIQLMKLKNTLRFMIGSLFL